MDRAMIKRSVATILLGGVMLLTIAGCDGQSGSDGRTGQVIIEPTTSVVVAAALPGQTATLDILGVQTGIPMTVNPDGTVVATVGSVPEGTRTFRITYRVPSGSQLVTVAEASGTGNVVAGVTTTVTLTTLDTTMDADNDGSTNLNEIKFGTDPLDPNSKGAPAMQVAVGGDHSCALITDGRVQCWGSNESGQLGNGTTTNSPTPVPVTGISSATSVATGQSHSCATLADGRVQCWGHNGIGSLGNGTTTNSPTPVAVTGISSASSVTAGQFHTCARLADGIVWCWGSNRDGQLGDSSTFNRFEPVQVSGLGDVASVTAGNDHTCAFFGAPAIRCWGDNTNGQLGNNTNVDSLVPAIAVIGINFPEAIAAGISHNCALVSGGEVFCWGNNDSRQLGDGTRTERRTAVSVQRLPGSSLSIGAGGGNSCAVLEGGTIYCWGTNSFGQLGDGTTVQRLDPVSVKGITTATSVAAAGNGSDDHSCAVLSDHTVRCWGINTNGQLGDGTTINSSTPVRVKKLF